MNKKQYKEFYKRYDKFKDYNLPTPFWDEERQTYEYVYFYMNQPKISNSLYEALGDVAIDNLYYPFTSGYLMGTIETNYKMVYEVGHNHAHSFEEVVRWLYEFPETFSISKDEEEFYSKRELEYLRNVKEYLLFIGMKDARSNRKSFGRYKNKKRAIYEHSNIRTSNEEEIEKIINGKINNFFYNPMYPEHFPDYKEYKDRERTTLIRDEKGKMKAFIEYTHFEKKQYKDLKEKYPNKELKDDDYIIVEYFKVLKKF